MSIGKPQPKAWNRHRMNKTHRKGKATAKHNAVKKERIASKRELEAHVIDRAKASPAEVKAAIAMAVQSRRTLTVTENGKPRFQIVTPKPIVDDDEDVGAHCRIYDRACATHGFYHGAEASELREGIEKLIAKPPHADCPCGQEIVESLVDDLRDLLEKVDARDSVARLESQLPKKRKR